MRQFRKYAIKWGNSLINWGSIDLFMKTHPLVTPLLLSLASLASAQVVTIDDPQQLQKSSPAPTRVAAQPVQYTQPVQQPVQYTQPVQQTQQSPAPMSPGAVPIYESARNYVSLSGQIWLPHDTLFDEGGGIISEDEKVEFYGFGIEVGTSLSLNNRHWGYLDFRCGGGTYERDTEVFTNPNNPNKSDRFLLENDMFLFSFTAGYRYLRPLNRGITMIVGAYGGLGAVGFNDPFYDPYYDPYDPYYDSYYDDYDWSDNSEIGAVVGAEIGFEFQITPHTFLSLSYGVEFHSASPDYEFTKKRNASTRPIVYQNISVAVGWQF